MTKLSGMGFLVAVVCVMGIAGSAWANGFQGNVSDTWFLVKGPMESQGLAWSPGEVARMKQGMKLYLHLVENPGSDPMTYRSKVYSQVDYSQDLGPCWQIQGEVPAIQVFASDEGDSAFFMYFGEGTVYQDQPGIWISRTVSQAVWGILRVLDLDKNKIKMEFRLGLFIPDDPDRAGEQGGVQFGQFKGGSVVLPPSPLCPNAASR